MRSRSAIVAVLCVVVAQRDARAQNVRGQGVPAGGAVIREWTVPWPNTRPRDPYPDARGRVWFVGQEGNYVAYVDTATGRFKRYTIDAGTNPHDLVVDPRGAVWFTGNRNGRIVRLDPESGKLQTFPMPDSTVRDPHTMVFDRRGDAWFTAQGAGVVGRLTPATGSIRLWRLAPQSRPYGIVIDGSGRPWFDEFGTNRIGTIDPKTLALREYSLPNERARPRRIALAGDGGIWYGDYVRGFLGRLDPATGKVEEWPLPSGAGSLPYAMTSDGADRIWLVETGPQPNRLVTFDVRTKSWTGSTPVPGSPNTVRHMVYDPRAQAIWYGSDVGMIGRAGVRMGVVP